MAMSQQLLEQRLRSRIREIRHEGLIVSDQWSEIREKFRKMLLEGDITNFLNWPIVQGRMTYEPSVEAINFLQDLPNWKDWENALIRSSIGNPKFYEPFPQSCGNLVTQACHLATILTRTGYDIKDFNSVFEFGGGFGNMCRLVYSLGFSGKYVIMDLPELCALQEYYINSTEPSRCVSYEELSGKDEVLLLTNKIDFMKQMREGTDRKLFFALWSLSESPFNLRDEIFETVCSTVDCILIGYQDEWYGYDNVKYFKELSEKNKRYSWEFQPALVFGNKLTYLIGKGI